jgi:hypothetical protein
VLPAAEPIRLLGNSMALAGHFGPGSVDDRDLAAGLHVVIVKEDTRDAPIRVECPENVMKRSAGPSAVSCTMPARNGPDSRTEDIRMKEVKALYHNGGIQFLEPVPDLKPELGPVEVVVLFPEATDEDPWRKILAETTPRPSFLKYVEEVEREIAEGKTEPLDLDRL